MIDESANILEGVAKFVGFVLNWFNDLERTYNMGRFGPKIEKPKRMIPCLFWAIGPVVTVGFGNPASALAAGLLGLGASCILIIIWDDAPRTIRAVMWGGAAAGLGAAMYAIARAFAHVAHI